MGRVQQVLRLLTPPAAQHGNVVVGERPEQGRRRPPAALRLTSWVRGIGPGPPAAAAAYRRIMVDVPSAVISDGVRMPMIGLGTSGLLGRHGYDALRQAIDLGYRHLDTATAYDNEAEVGRAVRDSGVSRDQVFLTTKLPPERADEPSVVLDQSLRDLGVDHIDLWLIHWPPHRTAAPETWRALTEAVSSGRARAAGVSNYSVAQLDELIEATGVTPAVNQIPYSTRHHDPALLEAHRTRGITVEGYSPLKRSDLTDPVLTKIAAAHQVTPAEVVLRWHLDHGIVAIPKSANPDRLRTNLAAATLTLTSDEIAAVDDLTA
jgi:2,5-diketo-D-gluconate reductase A